jgi:hypothetical protein
VREVRHDKTVITVGPPEGDLEHEGLPTEVAAFQLAADMLGPVRMNAIGEVRIRRPNGTEISHEEIVAWAKKNPAS